MNNVMINIKFMIIWICFCFWLNWLNDVYGRKIKVSRSLNKKLIMWVKLLM